MRRMFGGWLVAVAVALLPTGALAGNQEVAEQIAAALKNSGKLHSYRIGVKYQDGTAWLKGQVASRDQMATAMQLAFSVPGVTRVVNNLTVASETTNEAPATAQRVASQFVPTSRPQIAMTGLQEPVLTAPEPPSRPEVAPMESHEPVLTAPERPSQPEVAMTGLQEPTLAPKPSREQTEPQPQVVKPARPMPLGYSQPLPIAQANNRTASAQPMAIPSGAAPARYDQPNMPNYAWPSYSPYPNYASLTYPKQYSPTAWPYIGPFYPYPQVPLGWRKVTLEWHDGWWALDFDDGTAKGPFSGLFRPTKRKY